MATSDSQRLLLQVDAAVELARKNMRDLATAVDRDAMAMDASLGRVEKSHARMTGTLAKTGQARMGMQQLSFQVSDVATQMAMGTRASVIFAQQSGQVIQALQLMGGQGNAFLRFLAGPWGIALSAAAVVASSFAGKLFDNRDELTKLVDKMREHAHQAQLNKRADEAWKDTVEGLTESIRKRREEQEKGLQTDIQAEQKSLEEFKKERDQAERDLAAKQKALRSAEAELAKRQGLARGNVDPQLASTFRQDVETQQKKVDLLKRDLATLEANVAAAETSVRGAEVVIGERRVEAQLDKVAAATDAYTAALGRLRQERTKGKISQAEFDRQLLAEKKKLEAAKDAAGKDKPDNFGRNISDLQRAEFYNAAAGFKGLSETSGKSQLMALFREASINVDPQMVAWCAAFVNAVLASKGVTGTGSLGARSFLNFGQATNDPKKGDIVVLKGGRGADSGHVGFFDSFDKKGDVRVLGGNQGNAVGVSTYAKSKVLGFRQAPSPASAADLAAKAAEKTADQDDAFRARMADLNDRLLAAQIELVTGIEAQAEFAKDQVDSAQKDYEAQLDKDVREGRLRETQAEELKTKSQAVATAKKATIEQRKTLELMEKRNEALAQESDFAIEALRFKDEMAKTQAEHRAIQLEILAALYAQREADLKIAKAKAEAAQDWEEAARVQRELDMLPERRGRDEQRTMRDTQGPLERWADGVPQTAAEMNEFFQQLEVDGINGAIDSIMALSEGFESFRDTAINAIKAVIAQLIRMQLMKLALNLIGGAAGAPGAGSLGGFNTAGLTFGMGMGGLAGIPGLPGGATGLVGTIGGNGGRDGNVLSINGRPQWRVERGETLAVLPKAPNVRIPSAANGNAPARGGDSYTINVPIHGLRDRRDADRTGLQLGGAVKRQLARTVKRGG